MKFKCLICGKEFDKIRGSGKHFKYVHNMSIKEYYDKYIKKPDEGICKTCGKPTRFNRFSEGYHDFCSSKCANLSQITKNKIEQTNMKIRGVPYSFQSEEVKKKIEESLLKNHGVKRPSHSKKIREKQRQTLLKNHNVINPSQIPEVKERREITVKKHYGEKGRASKEIVNKMLDTRYKNHGSYSLNKKYLYNDLYFDSSWELIYYIWLKDHCIKFEYHPSKHFNYECDNKTHKYCPDFLVESEYIEIKGLQFFDKQNPLNKMVCPYDHKLDNQYEAKHQCMIQNNVIIITNILQYQNYVNEKYGNDYIESFAVKKDKKDKNEE